MGKSSVRLFIMAMRGTSLTSMVVWGVSKSGQLMCQKTDNKNFKCAVTESLELADHHQSQFHCTPV